MKKQVKAVLLLGSNLGNSRLILEQALKEIAIHAGTVLQTSSVFETEPWGEKDQPFFLNQAVEISTGLAPEKLLLTLNQVEEKLGRKRREKWKERIIDIDILFYSDIIYQSAHLIIPHPQIQQRRFALEPLSEILPDFFHPVLKKTVSELLLQCEDRLRVTKRDFYHEV